MKLRYRKVRHQGGYAVKDTKTGRFVVVLNRRAGKPMTEHEADTLAHRKNRQGFGQ